MGYIQDAIAAAKADDDAIVRRANEEAKRYQAEEAKREKDARDLGPKAAARWFESMGLSVSTPAEIVEFVVVS